MGKENNIINLLPNDEQAYDAVMELRKEVKSKNQDENIIDVNGWLMGINWCKDFIKEQLTKQQ